MRHSSVFILATIGLLAVGCSHEGPPAAYGAGGTNAEPTSAGDVGKGVARANTAPMQSKLVPGYETGPGVPLAAGPGINARMGNGRTTSNTAGVPMAYGPGATYKTQ